MAEYLVPSGLKACRACALYSNPAHLTVVPGYGSLSAQIMFVAQSPGSDENIQGRPLVGKSGMLLAKYCQRAGINLDEEIFRTNVNKCHPIANRKANMAEVKACTPWLIEEIKAIKPTVIVAVGDTALKWFLPDETKKITSIRGSVFDRVIAGHPCKIIPTIHPAFVARNEQAYGRWLLADLQTALRVSRAPGVTTKAALPFRTTEATWDEVLEAVKAPLWGFDLETDTGSGDEVYENDQGLRGARVIGLSVCNVPGNGLYHRFSSDDEAAERIAELKEALEDPLRVVVASNAKFEKHILHSYGVHPKSIEDTLLMAYICGDFPLGLKDGVHRAFGIEMIRIDTFTAQGFKQRDPITNKWIVDMRAAQEYVPEAVITYAAQDADASLRLYHYLLPILKNRGLFELYSGIEIPFTDIIVEMERNGIPFKPERLAQASTEIKSDTAVTHANIVTMIDEEVNVYSVNQVKRALYEIDTPYIIPAQAGTGAMPTDKTSLAVHMGNPLITAILTERALRKMMSTYIIALPKYVDNSGRIHTDFSQTGAETGRISSRRPNLTNIPARKREDISVSLEGSAIRDAFYAPPGYVFAAVDLSQIEMRIAAHLSGDPAMIEELGPGGDIHARSCRTVYNIPETWFLPNKEPNPEFISADDWKNKRFTAKTANFGALYRLSEIGLMKRCPQLNLTFSQAKDFIDGIYSTFNLLRVWQTEIVKFARNNGYAPTITGRRRYIPDITSKDQTRRGEAERAAINHPIQGSAADFFKRALLKVRAYLTLIGSNASMVGQVHDELNLLIPEEEVERLSVDLPPIMGSAFELAVPVFVDFEYGRTWANTHSTKYWKTTTGSHIPPILVH